MKRLLVRVVLKLLASFNLSTADKALLITGIVDKLHAIPTSDILEFKDGQLFLQGRPVDIEKARQLKESSLAALDNYAEKIIEEHVLYKAITIGVHKADSSENMIFSRSAIWWEQQRKAFLKLLAYNGDPGSTQDL